MRIVARIDNNLLNSRNLTTTNELEKIFKIAPNAAAKTIRLFPHHAVSFFTEGLGEIWDVKEKRNNFIPINEKSYKWRLVGHTKASPKFVTRVTGGPIVSGSYYGEGHTDFIIALETSYYNPNDLIRLADNTILFVKSDARRVAEKTFEYTVQIMSNNPLSSVNGSVMQPNMETGWAGVAFPEISYKGYMKIAKSSEEHINYLTTFRYDWSWSADAAATKYLIEDVVTHNGQNKKTFYITDELMRNALEIYHLNKELQLIYGKSSVDATGRCFVQDPETGQDIYTGDGIIAQLADSRKQNYTKLSINLIEDIIIDMARQAPKPTGNTFLLTCGMDAYAEFGRIMRAEHKSGWQLQPNTYVRTRDGGKIQLGAEYNAYSFQGNTLVVSVNTVFGHKDNPSKLDSYGRKLSDSTLLFLDMNTYEGTRNIQMIAKDGRSFIVSELDGVGGADGRTSGKVSSPVTASKKIISGSYGVVVHNPYSSVLLEKVEI